MPRLSVFSSSKAKDSVIDNTPIRGIMDLHGNPQSQAKAQKSPLLNKLFLIEKYLWIGLWKYYQGFLGTNAFQIIFKHLSSVFRIKPSLFASQPGSDILRILKIYLALTISISLRVLFESSSSFRSFLSCSRTFGFVMRGMLFHLNYKIHTGYLL